MRAKNAIDDKFKHLKVDHQKPDVDEEVKYGRQRALKHFLLTESNQDHVLQPITFAIGDVILFPQTDIIPDEKDTLTNKKTRRAKRKYKKYLLKDSHAPKIMNSKANFLDGKKQF